MFSIRKTVNRVSIPLTYLESDTTLAHAHYQKALKAGKEAVQFLKYVNGTLGVLMVIAAVCFLLEVALGRPRLTDLPEWASPVNEIPLPSRPDPEATWNDLQQLMERRNIFEPVDTVSASQKIAFEQEILQRIRIVGVVLTEAPKAIIEIIASGETVFVSEGDTVSGAIVKGIFEDKVILTYNGTELELLR